MNQGVQIKHDPSSALEFLKDATLEDIERAENEMDDLGLNQVKVLNDNGLVHKLCNGMYCRSLFIPKSGILTGAIHLNPYIDICAYGDILVKSFYCDGRIDNIERVSGFKFMEGDPGRKRVGIAIEDTLWITVDPTRVSNVDEAEEDICVRQSDSYKLLEEVSKCQQQ